MKAKQRTGTPGKGAATLWAVAALAGASISPAAAQITVDGWEEFTSDNPAIGLFDADGSDKLVLVVAGEHGFPNNFTGDFQDVQYNGVSMVKAVEQAPVDGAHQTTVDIWYLDDPGPIGSGFNLATNNLNGWYATAYALSGTAAEVGATASASGSSVSLTTTLPDSLVIAVHGNGGLGNTGTVPDADPPLTETSSGLWNNRGWGGQGSGYATIGGPGAVALSFSATGDDSATVAAEFTLALDDSDGDGIDDFWEDQYFGNDDGTVEASDLTGTDGSGDADGDGATDNQEFLAGSDPTVSDTDGDGLDDGDEINTHGTNPTLADTDGDTLSDDVELAGPTDPLLADTDGDNLRDDEELIEGTDGFITDPTLVDSDSDGVNDDLDTDPLDPGNDNDGDGLGNDNEATLGTDPLVADSDGDGIDDGEEVEEGADGFITDPLDSDSDDDGVTDGGDTAPTDPGNDTDGDGIGNGEEVGTHGTDPLVADTDGDGIDDGEEISEGTDGFVTDPLSVDSDGDAIPDGQELTLGSDPTDRASVPTSGPAGLVAGSTVQVSTNNVDFNISVFPGAAGYEGDNESPVTSGTFGDGTVLDYRFFDSPDESINSYADGGGGLIGMATSQPENINGAGESWSDLWTVTDPEGFTTAPDLATDVNTFARSANITGTIDISGLRSGTIYIPHGTFINAWSLNLVMSSPSQPDVEVTVEQGNGPGTNFGWITSFAFFNASNYDTITYTYTNTDTDGSRARFMGIILDGVAAPTLPFGLIVTSEGANLTLEWESKAGFLYNLRSSTDLSAPLEDWGLVEIDGQVDIAATPPANIVSIPRPGDATRFYRVEEFPPPPLLDENFDSVAGPGLPDGWSTAATAWEVGDPSDGVFSGPMAANSGPNCAGTVIGDNYAASTDYSLVTPALAIPADGATLSYQQFIDTDLPGDGTGDIGTVRILDADNGDAVIEELNPPGNIEGISAGWSAESFVLPASANGANIKIEFRFVSDDNTLQFAGFYVDDVLVEAN